MMTSKQIRQVVLDTETTGMNKDGTIYLGHRIIEIGCVEIINRRLTGRHFHVYIKPDRIIDPEAVVVHGITDEFLKNKPSFAQIADEFIDFIKEADLVIHNASFDIGFMDQEFRFLNQKIQTTQAMCSVTDTLVLAKKMFPGKRNNLDALSDRYGVDCKHRTLHGALLDAEILADVYLLMSGGQAKLNLTGNDQGNLDYGLRRRINNSPLTIIRADVNELDAHKYRLAMIKEHLWII
ncbi:MAG: DNA polymerase III subunit epsilon [Psychromonas sp.]|nr:DNA polymerase III subunit epsilon [Psychromonas sp.]